MPPLITLSDLSREFIKLVPQSLVIDGPRILAAAFLLEFGHDHAVDVELGHGDLQPVSSLHCLELGALRLEVDASYRVTLEADLDIVRGQRLLAQRDIVIRLGVVAFGVDIVEKVDDQPLPVLCLPEHGRHARTWAHRRLSWDLPAQPTALPER